MTVRPYRLLDTIVPITPPPSKGGHRNEPKYEAALVDALRNEVQSGDDVVIIGGGIGVSSVVAARAAGPLGSVVTFEGAASQLNYLQETLILNGIRNVSCRHAIVGIAKHLEGNPGGADTIAASNLPECDVLAMDCEGAEREILSELGIRPRTVIVETHGNLASVTSYVKKMGYKVSSKQVAEESPYERRCLRNGIFVLTAKQIQK